MNPVNFYKNLLTTLLLFGVLKLFAQPANDDCANAVPIMLGNDEATAVAVEGNTTGGTPSSTPQSVCSGGWFGDDIWFSVDLIDVPENGIIVQLEFGENEGDILTAGMAFYASCDVDAPALACFSDGSGTVDRLEISPVCLMPENTFYIRVWSGGSANDNSGTMRVKAYIGSERETDDLRTFASWDFNDGYQGWTTGSMTEDAGDTMIWFPDGVLPTAFGTMSGFANIESMCTGMLGFPSGWYQTGRTGDPLQIPPGGPPYPRHWGYIQSPAIDVSDTECEAIAVSFDEIFRGLNGGDSSNLGAFLQWSVDGGQTFVGRVDLTDNRVFNQTYNENTTVVLSDVGGTENLVIRLNFEGDFYYAGWDNIRVFEPELHDMRVQSNFYAIAPSLFTPHNQADRLAFLADIRNQGCVEQTNVKLNMTVIDDQQSVVFSGDNDYGSVAGGALIENVLFPDTYTPEPGVVVNDTVVWFGAYTISADSVDANEEDNQITFPFAFTENFWQKHNGTNSATTPADGNWGDGEPHTWGYGMHIYVPNGGMTNTVSVDLVLNENPDLAGIFYEVNMYEIDMEQIITGPDAITAESRTLVASGEHEVTGTAGVFTIELEASEGDQVILKDNTHYVVMVEYFDDDATTDWNLLFSSGQFDYAAMNLASNQLAEETGDINEKRYNGVAYFSNDEDPNFGLVGFGFDFSVGINLRVDMAVSTTTPLSDENLMSVYPNPTSDQIILDMSLVELDETAVVNIMDISGKMIKRYQLSDVQVIRKAFNVKDLAAGTYVLQYISETGTRSIRFTKQ